MEAIVIAYLIAAFASGSLATSWINHNTVVKEHRAMETIDADMIYLSQKMTDPGCDEPCRISLDKKYRKLMKKSAKLAKKYDTTGSRGLAMNVTREVQ